MLDIKIQEDSFSYLLKFHFLQRCGPFGTFILNTCSRWHVWKNMYTNEKEARESLAAARQTLVFSEGFKPNSDLPDECPKGRERFSPRVRNLRENCYFITAVVTEGCPKLLFMPKCYFLWHKMGQRLDFCCPDARKTFSMLFYTFPDGFGRRTKLVLL